MTELKPANQTKQFGNVSEIQQNETVGFMNMSDQELMFGDL